MAWWNNSKDLAGAAPAAARIAFDPLDLGLADAVLGQDDKPPQTKAEEAAMQKALDDYYASIAEYEKNGFTPYEWQGDLAFQELGDLPQLGDTELAGITTDPRYQDAEDAALAALEDQARNGLTARDKADMAKLEGDVNRRNAGRMGAIRQGMAARGISGSGLDLVQQQMAAQDAVEREALAALEKNAQAAERRTQGAIQAGNLAGKMSAEEYRREAATAQAQDHIKEFNTNNSIGRLQYNNKGVNDTAQYNATGRQNTANNTVTGQNQFSTNVLGAKGDAAKVGYNSATDAANRKLGQWEGEQNRDNQFKTGVISGVGSVLGGIASDKRVKDDVRTESDEDIEHFLSAIAPKSFKYKGSDEPKHGVLAQDLERSEIGRGMVKEVAGTKAIDPADAISGLLQAVAYLNQKIEGK